MIWMLFKYNTHNMHLCYSNRCLRKTTQTCYTSILNSFTILLFIAPGFAIGSLIGGILYKLFGGVTTLRIFSSIAAITAFIYLILYSLYLKDITPGSKTNSH